MTIKSITVGNKNFEFDRSKEDQDKAGNTLETLDELGLKYSINEYPPDWKKFNDHLKDLAIETLDSISKNLKSGNLKPAFNSFLLSYAGDEWGSEQYYIPVGRDGIIKFAEECAIDVCDTGIFSDTTEVDLGNIIIYIYLSK